MGNIYNSKYRSGPMITMHQNLKIVNGYKDNTPGPGSYLHFSQFGMWVPKSRTNSYNVRKRIKTANNSIDNIKNYFRKKMKKAIEEKYYSEKKGRIVSALR